MKLFLIGAIGISPSKNFNISVDKNYEKFISKLSASFSRKKKVSRNFTMLVQVYLDA